MGFKLNIPTDQLHFPKRVARKSRENRARSSHALAMLVAIQRPKQQPAVGLSNARSIRIQTSSIDNGRIQNPVPSLLVPENLIGLI